MKITILNGNPDKSNLNFDGLLSNMEAMLLNGGHVVSSFLLRDLNINYCRGCFGCWLKTPGECVIADESRTITKTYINSDLVIFASPMILGFTSSILKKAIDRLIPLVHPYFELDHSEVHHRARYDRYSKLGILLEKSSTTDEKDIESMNEIYTRNALNLKTSISFSLNTKEPIERIALCIRYQLHLTRDNSHISFFYIKTSLP